MALPAASHPGFLQVFASRRAYTTLLYLMLSLATGVAAFTFTVTGLSLSFGLAILIIGLPVALTFLAGARLLAVAEAHWLRVMVGDTASVAPALLPPGQGFLPRLKAMLGDRRTWTGLLYLLLLMPLGVAYFSTCTTLLSLSLGLLAASVAHLFAATGAFTVDFGHAAWVLAHPNLTALLCGLTGLLLLPLTFHLALLLGRFQLWLAKHLLVQA